MSIFKKIALLFIISFILMSIIGLWIDKINTKRIDNIVKEKYVSFLEHVLSSENDSQKLIKIFESNKFKIKRNSHISLNEILFHKKYSFVEVSIYKISFDDELFIKLKFENDEYFLKTPDEENLRDKTVLNILICIDEGDLYLHPKWQADFFYKLIKLVPMFKSANYQFVLTSHSPFLVSDLPRQNLIFLSVNSDNQSIIADQDEHIKTFGGNVGELYIDAFFMEGGLISRFAASKIQALIDKINNKVSLSEEDQLIINSIGDEFINIHIENLRNG